jgi:short subunit dehydrogenase-like uncharacterized protein
MDCIKKTDREYDLIVYGATGFTGTLACNYLAKQYADKSVKWCIAGRSRGKLEALAAANGNPGIYVAEADNEAALNLMCAKTRAVAACAGPFSRYGKKLVAACVNQGTDYCDITGEIDFVREMISLHDEAARKSGARIVHLCGHDSIPWDISTLMLSKQLKKVEKNENAKLKRVDLYTHIKSAPSGGTLETAFDIMFGGKKEVHPEVKKLGYDPLLKCNGEKSNNNVKSRNISTISSSSSELIKSHPNIAKRSVRTLFFMAGVNANAVKRSNAFNGYGDDLIYCEGQAFSSMFNGIKYLLGLMMFGIALVIPPIRYLLREFVLPKPGQGPSAESMEKGFLVVTGVGHSVNSNTPPVTSVMQFHVDPGYKDTSRMVVEAALTLALDSDKMENKLGGVYTPAACQGEALLNRLCATGTTFEAK